MFGHDPFGILAYAVNPPDAATGPLGSGLASAGATASAATTKAVTQPAAARAGATGRAFSLKAITSPAATQIGQSGAVTATQPAGITYQARASGGGRSSVLSVQGPATAVTGQIFWGNAWQAQPDWRKRMHDNRVALGLVPAPKAEKADKAGKANNRPVIARIELPALPDAGAALAFVRAKLAENNALQAEAAAKATRARAVVTRERQQARQAELSAQIAAIEILETVIQQEIEETDVAFVAMLLMEGTD